MDKKQMLNNIREKVDDMNYHLNEKLDQIENKMNEPKLSSSLKQEIKSCLHREKELAKKSYKVAKKTGKKIKDEVKKELSDDDNSMF